MIFDHGGLYVMMAIVWVFSGVPRQRLHYCRRHTAGVVSNDERLSDWGGGWSSTLCAPIPVKLNIWIDPPTLLRYMDQPLNSCSYDMSTLTVDFVAVDDFSM